MNSKWKIIIGLGNPGEKYKSTYHNIGKKAVDIFSCENNFKKPFSIWKNKPFKFLIKDNLIFIKPLSFMNNSGISVLSALNHFKLTPEDILIIHDDSDIELGKFKLAEKGSSAGHKGVESIIKYLKTENFDRLKIGIRSERNKDKKAIDFVLSPMPTEEYKIIEKLLTDLRLLYFKR